MVGPFFDSFPLFSDVFYESCARPDVLSTACVTDEVKYRNADQANWGFPQEFWPGWT
jgi:hypothetical protein